MRATAGFDEWLGRDRAARSRAWLSDDADAYVETSVGASMKFLLGCSDERVRELIREWWDWKAWSRSRWRQAGSESPAQSLQRMHKMTLLGGAGLASSFETATGGALIAMPHMGDYLCGVMRMLAESRPRHVLILRRRGETNVELSAFRKLELLGHRVGVERMNRVAAIRALRVLRSDGVVVAFHDLSSRWGSVAASRFLRGFVAFVDGPARLGIAAGSRVLVGVAVEGRSSSLRLAADIDAQQFSNDSLGRRELAQKMIAAVEPDVLARPAQWNNWHLALEALQGDGVADLSVISM